MKKLILSLFIVCTVLMSCEEFLDEKPQKQMVIPNTLDDFQALLDAEPRSMNSAPKMGFLSSDELFLSNTLLNLMTLEERAAYFWQPDLYLPDDAGVDWAFSYGKIFYANLVIEGVRDFSPNSPEQKNRAVQLDAAARFYRAFAHFSLVQEFAPPYDPANPDAIGIPIRRDANINAKSERVSIKDVYAFIIEDLERARMILSEKPDIPTRASKWAAEALLSRIYLSIQNYEKALEHSTNALAIDNTLMDYNNLDPSLRYSFERFNQEVIHHARMFSGRFTSNSQTYVDPELFELYDSLDLRKTVFFRPAPVNGFYNVFGKYTGAIYMYGGLATDEVLLDHAEASARLGNEIQALNDLNYLLQNRYKQGEYDPLENINGKELIKTIVTERRKELVFRGVRWLDLRRYNQDPDLAVTLNRKWNEVDNTLPPNSDRYTFPIPPREVDLNDLL